MSSDLDPTVRELIARQAQWLVCRGFPSQDRPDLEQHLSAVVLRRLVSFDGQRSTLRSFVTTIVARAARNLLRHRFAACRNDRRTRRQDMDEVPDHRTAEQRERTEFALDLADFLARLPPDLQELADLLKTETMAVAARKLGVARSTAVSWGAKIRERFEKSGMQKYL